MERNKAAWLITARENKKQKRVQKSKVVCVCCVMALCFVRTLSLFRGRGHGWEHGARVWCLNISHVPSPTHAVQRQLYHDVSGCSLSVPHYLLSSASAGCRCARYWRHWMMHEASVVSTCFIRCYLWAAAGSWAWTRMEMTARTLWVSRDEETDTVTQRM